MCHPTGSGAGSIFFSGSFFVFLFLLSSVPPRAQADLPTKPTGNGLSSLPTKSTREEVQSRIVAASRRRFFAASRTGARTRGGHVLEDSVAAWRGACPGASPDAWPCSLARFPTGNAPWHDSRHVLHRQLFHRHVFAFLAFLILARTILSRNGYECCC